MIITISGEPGSGKSTLGKSLAQELNYEFLSIGKKIRAFAKEEGENILELMKDKEDFAKIQKKIERYLNTLQHKDNIVIDGRDAFYHLPRSLKILLTVDDTIAAERVFKAKRATESSTSKEEALKKIQERKKREKKLYHEMHGIDYCDTKQYDIVLDTSSTTPEEEVKDILKRIKRIKKK